MMYQMFLQFMPQMPAQNTFQPPPRVSTQRVHGTNPSRPAEYQLVEERIRVIEGFFALSLNAR